MSDNDDLLGDDLGDQSLADYNLGNEEEEQLLADDYDINASQNVPPSIGHNFEAAQMAETDYTASSYGSQQEPYPLGETECVVPNIIVEVPAPPLVPPMQPAMVVEHPTYAPYEPPRYEVENAVVPPAIPAGPMESPQIVPSEMLPAPINNDEMMPGRERFISERPANMRTPQVRDIPDSLDKVMVGPRGRRPPPPGVAPASPLAPGTPWRHSGYAPRYNHPYRRNNVPRGNFPPRGPYPRSAPPAPSPAPTPTPQPPLAPHPPPEAPQFRPLPPPAPTPRYFAPNRPYFRPQYRFNEVVNMPQVTIRQPMPQGLPQKMDEFAAKMRAPEVRMLPVHPPTAPTGPHAAHPAPTGKIVLINPHFKGNFQPPVEGLSLPAYIPTRIQKSPPISPTLESKFGPVKDIDEAAERFIAEQRSALARAAHRNQRREPQRFIENTTIEIENDMLRADDADLLRRQEEFIHANRAGLRRRMRSPSPPRRSRSPSPCPSPGAGVPPSSPTPAGALAPRRRVADATRHGPLDEESEYRRRLREQETLRERVLRAKEVRRRKNAVTLHKQLQERQRQEKETSRTETERDRNPTNTQTDSKKPEPPQKPPQRDRSPTKPTAVEPSNENLTPPRENLPKLPKVVENKDTVENKVEKSPERNLTPPLPAPEKTKKEDKKLDSDVDLDDLDLILDDIEGILSDDEDSGRFKEKAKKTPEVPKPKSVDLRNKLPPKSTEHKRPKQRIVFDREERRAKSPPAKKSTVSSTTNLENDENIDKKQTKAKQDAENSLKMRQRIIFDKKEKEPESVERREEQKRSPPAPSATPATPAPFSRRVVLQRKQSDKPDKSVFSRIEMKSDPSKPNPGIFSRAFRTAVGTDNPRIVVKRNEPEVEVATESDCDEEEGAGGEREREREGGVAEVTNLPHGITDTRLKTLAGNDVQNLSLDKEKRSAKITFKSSSAAKSFKQKFNNKMVAASRLSVTIR